MNDKVIFAPDVPEDVRRLLGASPRDCVPYDRPAGHYGQSLPRQAFIACWNGAYRVSSSAPVTALFGAGGVVVSVLLTLVLPDGGFGHPEYLVGGLGALGTLTGLGLGVTEPRYGAVDRKGRPAHPGLVDAPYRKVNRMAVRYHRRYLRPSDLDEQGRAVVRRAYVAVKGVLTASVVEDGLLDEIANGVILPDELWDVAEAARRQGRLRAEQAATDHLPSTPELEAVRGPQRAALAAAERAVDERVAVLEGYARRVALADSVYAAQAVAGNDGAYLDLLAETPDRSAMAALSADARSLHVRLAEAVEAGRGIGSG